MIRFMQSILLAVMLTGIANAATTPQQLGPFTADLQMVRASKDGALIYGQATRRIYVSRDVGATWQPVYAVANGISDIAVSENTPAYLYVLDSKGIVHASADGGQTWQQRANPLSDTNPTSYDVSYVQMAVDPVDPLRLWLAQPNALATSADGGKSWTSIPTSTLVAAAQLKPSELDLLGHLYFDGKGGRIVQALESRNAPYYKQVGTPVHILLESLDNGQSWTRLPSPVIPGAESLEHGAWQRNEIIGSDRVPVISAFTDNADYVFRYDMASGQYVDIRPSNMARDGRFIWVDKNGGAMLTGTDKYTPTPSASSLISTDNGQTWRAYTPPTKSINLTLVGSNLYLSSQGFWRSSDGGANWQNNRQRGVPIAAGSLSINCQGVRIPLLPDFDSGYQLGADGVWAKLSITNQQTPDPIAGLPHGLLAVTSTPLTSYPAYYTTPESISSARISQDCGKSWQAFDLAFLPKTSTTGYPLFLNKLMLSAHAGQWQLRAELLYKDGTLGLFNADRGIAFDYQSKDAGSNWVMVASQWMPRSYVGKGLISTPVINAQDPTQQIRTVSYPDYKGNGPWDQRAEYSLDGGLNWLTATYTEGYLPSPDRGNVGSKFEALNSAANEVGTFRMTMSIPHYERADSLKLLSTEKVTMVSRDGGKTWHIDGTRFQGYSHPNRNDERYRANGTAVQQSLDGGLSWSTRYTIPASTLGDIAINPDTETLYVGSDIGVWAMPVPPVPSMLSNLQISAGAPSVSFTADNHDYTLTVANDLTTLTLTPTLLTDATTATVNGLGVASGKASAPISLKQGLNYVDLQVAAKDGTNSQIYRIEVTRLAPALTNAESFQQAIRQADAASAINQQADGTIRVDLNGLQYSVLPSAVVTDTRAAQGFSLNNSGQILFTDVAGKQQTLYPIFADTLRLEHVLTAIDPKSTARTNNDGSVTVNLFGNVFQFVPEYALTDFPYLLPDSSSSPHAFQDWWLEDGKLFLRYTSKVSYTEVNPRITAQGFAVR